MPSDGGETGSVLSVGTQLFVLLPAAGDYPPRVPYETIPKFHDTVKRFRDSQKTHCGCEEQGKTLP